MPESVSRMVVGSWFPLIVSRFQAFRLFFWGGCCTIIDIPELHVDMHILAIQVYYNRLLVYG